MDILDKIVAEKRREVAALRTRAAEIKQQAAARRERRDFAPAVGGSSRHGGIATVSLIAEVKKASPSAGVICPDFDPVKVARQYAAAGANALSVLTDEQFFQGHLEYIRQIREQVKLPVLRKDFIIDELQVHESVAAGADAILLIVAILDDRQLRDYRQLASELRVAALVEVHDERELDRALAAGADIIGINNRDLRTFKVDLATTERLCAALGGSGIPAATGSSHALPNRDKNVAPTSTGSRIVVAESGINTRADVERVVRAGVNAILVGESLMRSGDIAGKVKELLKP